MVNFKFTKLHCYQQIRSFLITLYDSNQDKRFDRTKDEVALFCFCTKSVIL
jgi:hypothetical protein